MTPLPVAELRERLNRLERLIMRDGEANQWEAGEYFHPLIEMLEWAMPRARASAGEFLFRAMRTAANYSSKRRVW